MRCRHINNQLEFGDVGISDMLALAKNISLIVAPKDVLCLSGEIGAGKTTFARFFLGALGIVEEVPSPTFNLVFVYDTNNVPVWHFDFYRLSDAREVYELGFEDALEEGITLIEWPQRILGLLPNDRIDILISVDSSERRSIIVIGYGAMEKKILKYL